MKCFLPLLAFSDTLFGHFLLRMNLNVWPDIIILLLNHFDLFECLQSLIEMLHLSHNFEHIKRKKM